MLLGGLSVVNAQELLTPAGQLHGIVQLEIDIVGQERKENNIQS